MIKMLNQSKKTPEEMGIALFEENIMAKQDDSRLRLSVPVRYRLRGRLKNRWWVLSRYLHYSQNGVRMSVKGPLTVGQKLQLKMKLPTIQKPFELEGVVVWSRASQESEDVSECGVAFGDVKKVGNRRKFTQFLADRFSKILTQRSQKQMVARPVRTFEEMEAAYKLIYRQYHSRGFCRSNASMMYFNYHCLFPESRTFVLEWNHQLIGALTVFMDSPSGLPIETDFPDQIALLRNYGRKLAQIGLLALDLGVVGKKRFVLTDFKKLTAAFHLFKVAFDYVRSQDVTDIVIGAHPKQQDLYRYLTFRPFGSEKISKDFCDQLTLPMRMDVPWTLSVTPESHGVGSFFLRNSTPAKQFGKNFELTTEQLRKMLFSQDLLWSRVPAEARERFLLFHPDLM